MSRRTAFALGCCALAALAACTGRSASGSAGRTGASTVLVMQLNLCNSGIAACYTGRSVATAAALIRARRPDVVTLNEICRADLTSLGRAMGGVSAFRAALDRRTAGRPFRCRDGQLYGMGVLARKSAADAAIRTYGGRYPAQDRNDPEERVWLCVHAGLYACTTHTASASPAVALEQCRYLMTVALPDVMRRGGTDHVVLGADLNLVAGRDPGPESCVPEGYRRVDDGARQDIIVSTYFTVRSHSTVDMHGSTDHPALLVELTRSA